MRNRRQSKKARRAAVPVPGPAAADADQRHPLAGLSAIDRDAVEDLLRALLECEYRRQPASLPQISDETGISVAAVEAALEKARIAGMTERSDGTWALTAAGRELAVVVMRAHRLTETQLARESGLRAEQWHDVAHAVEHRLSRDEINRLADRLANPRFDPHGDPIPTREGRLPEPEGEPLPAWTSGEAAMIAHIEDEPPTLFARLDALGVCAGQRLTLIAASPQGYRLRIEGREILVPVELAALVRVRALKHDEGAPPPRAMRLTDLAPRRKARVLTLLPGCAGGERSRLLDLGFVPGSTIEHALENPLGSPVAYRVRGTLIALRREQAEQVLIDPLEI